MPVETYDMNQGWDSLAAEMLYASMNVPPQEAIFAGPIDEIDFYERCIRRNGGPALDLSCGTGRHLFPLTRRGLAVHGLDSSADAIRIATGIARQAGLDTAFYHQRMQELDIPGRYGTIFVSNGTLSVLSDRRDAFETLLRCRLHLSQGGQLLLESFVPDTMKGIRKYGVDDKAVTWEPVKCRSMDGEITTTLWTELLDPLEQLIEEKRRYDLVVGGSIVRSEEHTLRMRWFYKWELVMMLEKTGFEDIQLLSDYSERPATSESRVIIYSARAA